MADPVGIDARFSAADQTLAFALTWFATERVVSKPNQKMWMEILRDVLPLVTEDHPIVAPMVAAAKQVIVSVEFSGELSFRAHLDANTAVAKFAAWRAGRSYEVFQEQKEGAA